MQVPKPPLIITTTLMFSLTLLAATIFVPWHLMTAGFRWQEWLAMAVLWMLNGTAITAGYHRLWAHRSYKAHWSVRLWCALWGAMALQNSILVWVSGHRRHHTFVDHEVEDPYSARRGFWYSHIGWMLRDWDKKADDFSNVTDLQNDAIVVWQHRYYIPLALLMNLGVPMVIGAYSGDIVAALLLSGVLRLVISHHCTFLINSLAHIWGRSPYTDRNSARDNDLLALLTWGEGYHNFHHTFQRDYRNGVHWWQYDPTKWLIFLASKIRLTSDLHRVSEFRIAKARIDTQYKRAEKVLTSPSALQHLEEQYEAMIAALKTWSTLHQQKLEAYAEQLRSQWKASEAQLHYREIQIALKVQRGLWSRALSGHRI